jgi:sporulation protein YlmC with PRC-barrel domain
MRPKEVDLGLHVLDDQLVDREQTRCGRVDDIQLRGVIGKGTTVAALLVGPAAWPARLPGVLGRIVRPFVRGAVVAVPWDAVESIESAVTLNRSARELGLGTKDGTNAVWVDAEDGDSLRLSALLGRPVVAQSGRQLGRIQDVRANRVRVDPGTDIHEAWQVTGLLVGTRGLWQRLGLTRDVRLERERSAERPPNFIGWHRITALAGGRAIVAD